MKMQNKSEAIKFIEEEFISLACIDNSVNINLILLNEDQKKVAELDFNTVIEAEDFCKQNDLFLLNETDTQEFDENDILVLNI